ncbi:hypothetical protein Tco_0567226 [Tanacetum coccineum]
MDTSRDLLVRNTSLSRNMRGPLYRITTYYEVSLRKPTALENETTKPVVTFFTQVVQIVLWSKDEAPDFIIKLLDDASASAIRQMDSENWMNHETIHVDFDEMGLQWLLNIAFQRPRTLE